MNSSPPMLAKQAAGARLPAQPGICREYTLILKIGSSCTLRQKHHRCTVNAHPRTAFLSLGPGIVSACSCFASADPIPPKFPAATSADFRANIENQNPPRRHPIKGVIVDVRTDRQALPVKHEAIPGVMRAMTMTAICIRSACVIILPPIPG